MDSHLYGDIKRLCVIIFVFLLPRIRLLLYIMPTPNFLFQLLLDLIDQSNWLMKGHAAGHFFQMLHTPYVNSQLCCCA